MALVSPTRSTGDTAKEPLLSYTITTTPDPLKASPENTEAPEETGELLIVASRQDRTAADVRSITVHVPAGEMSPDLATNLDEVVPRISLPDWTVELNDKDEFVFTPTASHATIGPQEGLTIQLAQIPINRKVGTAPITVTEDSRETGSSDFDNRKTAFDVGKFPADFYMRNFICQPLVIDNGGEAELTWERSTNATYELLYGEVHIPDVTNETTRTITNIKTDTTFYLRGTAGDPSNPVVRILSAHVTVIRPDLDLGNLTVNGTTTLNGEVTANANVTIAEEQTLKVESLSGHWGGEALWLISGMLQARVPTAVFSELIVGKDHHLTVKEIRSNDGLKVTFADNLSVAGHLSVFDGLGVVGQLNAEDLYTGGTLQPAGPVSLGSPMSLLHESGLGGDSRTFTAGTSGLVVGAVEVYNNGGSGYATITSSTFGEAKAWWEDCGTATVTALVRKDDTFTVDFYGSHSDPHCRCRFYWLPFGNGSATPAAVKDAEQPAEHADGTKPVQADTD
ncbi:hypothetical protein QNO09_31520 [Streptomyces sp. 378]|uniref:hypothetical protein n=1 Tax=Streptomyces sp. 378 TaxID=3049412 RepID=UPI0024C23615|nr:hypothetical protein [Streptomyces sp. 378]MDK1347735.1 hypothetical protein [Streptomyces sp. 378]